MKHVKMLGLLVVVAASMLAIASSASATAVLTSPAGTEYTGEIHLTLESGTSTILFENTCTESTMKSKVTTNNTTHAAGAISVLTFDKCTKHTSTTKAGELTINDQGEVFATNNVIHIVQTGPFGNITCNYGGGASPGTKIGTLTTGTPAKIVVNTTHLKKLEPSHPFCPTESRWTANYVVTIPGSLFIT